MPVTTDLWMFWSLPFFFFFLSQRWSAKYLKGLYLTESHKLIQYCAKVLSHPSHLYILEEKWEIWAAIH